jgi:hypothetical protein
VFSLPLSLGAGPAERKADDRKDGAAQHNPKDDHGKILRDLLHRFLAVERKLEHVTSEIGEGGLPELVITGANVRIVNGLGASDTINALGNLFVGYNELRTDPTIPPNVRTGSHNLVLGRRNCWSDIAERSSGAREDER